MAEEEKMETDLTAEELQKENKEEVEKNDEEEVPSTAVEKKRPSSDLEGTEGPPPKKLCTEEGETSIVPCEVSSTSPHNSNGSSTSTKQVAVEETKEVVVEESEAAVSEDDLLALAQKAAE